MLPQETCTYIVPLRTRSKTLKSNFTYLGLGCATLTLSSTSGAFSTVWSKAFSTPSSLHSSCSSPLPSSSSLLQPSVTPPPCGASLHWPWQSWVSGGRAPPQEETVLAVPEVFLGEGQASPLLRSALVQHLHSTLRLWTPGPQEALH